MAIKKSKYNFSKIFRISYLLIGSLILILLFFYSPKTEYSKNYSFYRTPASQIFINKISNILIPYKPIYFCGNKSVQKMEFVQCWSEYKNLPAKNYWN